jgi:hypothetical protein
VQRQGPNQLANIVTEPCAVGPNMIKCLLITPLEIDRLRALGSHSFPEVFVFVGFTDLCPAASPTSTPAASLSRSTSSSRFF